MMLYIANWKMYLTLSQEIELAKKFVVELDGQNNKIIICPSFISLYPINQIINKNQIALGAQNCASINLGALTGEVSVTSLAEANCKFCIIGHSERRQNFAENNEIIFKKLELLTEQNIVPILCIGETLLENQQDRTKEVLKTQLSMALQNQKLKNLIIAYEPIWAIGTGNYAEPKYVKEIFDYIESLMLETKDKISYKMVYGGSVNGSMAKEFKKINNFSGFLVGKASTYLHEFLKIID